MMMQSKTVLGALLFGLAWPLAASAADMAESWPPVISHQRETPVEYGGTWYLRGDIGLILYSEPDLDWTGLPAGNSYTYNSAKFRNSWSIGGGVGMRFDQWFRADITFDYQFDSELSARGSGACAGAGTSCVSAQRGNFAAYTLMANGYVDFATWGGVTPYLGVGIGGAFLEWSNYQDVTTCVSGCAPFTVTTTMLETDERLRLAYSLMLGAAIDVAPKVKIDAGYRFVGIDDGEIVTGTATTGPIRYKDLYTHELRLGLRYDIQ